MKHVRQKSLELPHPSVQASCETTSFVAVHARLHRCIPAITNQNSKTRTLEVMPGQEYSPHDSLLLFLFRVPFKQYPECLFSSTCPRIICTCSCKEQHSNTQSTATGCHQEQVATTPQLGQSRISKWFFCPCVSCIPSSSH